MAALKTPETLKAAIWHHFGFRSNKENELDKSKAICKACQMEVKYCGNTTNLRNHMMRHHQDIISKPATGPQQMTLKQTLQLPTNSERSVKITEAIAGFICKDMRPYSVVENVGFRRLMKVMEPNYVIVSRKHLSEEVIPNMYQTVKDGVVCKLKTAERVGITSDTWTSVATESYMSVTAHYIDELWNLVSYVLQTTEVQTDHRSVSLAEMLTKAMEEWGLLSKDPAIVTDNAANMICAVEITGLTHVGCFEHIINLASQAGLKLPNVARLLGRVRHIAKFFHRSTTATRILKEKQKLLQLNAHKLKIDVVTRWNSTLEMLERFLEQQPAISAALLSPDVRRNEKDLCSLKEEDITDAEDVVRALKPMKTATQVMSEEKCPTLSVMAPLHALLLKEMTSLPEDSRVVKDTKDEIKKNLSTRYVNQKDMLYVASAIDPRFKALPFLNEEERDRTFSRLQTEAVCGMEEDAYNQDAVADEVDGVEEEVEPQPPAPKQFKQSSALESLLGEAYRPQQEVGPQKTKAAEAEDEIKRYRAGRPAGLQDNPLIWWWENEKEYPLLARMAKRYLCVPGTSVTSERVFSTAGDIITAKRSCLTPGHVNELLFLQKNLSIPE
ncbi:E3 SUMO-protein ligase ZBED1-like [Megalobrama amblycephala]|uniref:E3 SUMO-protein ligase ZBED1-like n=1 Tax=Megalobrama amblycephala TaxID=75352 RepID=UPI002013F7D6|nr:E3 SUMO-protein ligase ZBED1-like [Megalobrama amblycephala]XP_048036152.1 E3 SUMO-protein ligase ZBED1-like [Megalobrama amblycephala]